MMLSLPIGAWIDRHGGRLLFTRGVLAASALMLLMPWLGQPWMAVLGTAMLGLVLPFRTVPAQTEFLALLPHLSPSKAGWNRAAHTTGLFFLGPAASAAVIAGLGFTSVFELASAGLLAGFLIGRRVLSGGTPPAPEVAVESLWQRIRAQFAMVGRHAEMRRTMLVDCLTQMAVAYFVVFALVMAVRRFGMPLQAAAGLVTLQGAVFVVLLMAGGHWLSRWPQAWTYLGACVCLLLHTLLLGWAWAPWVLWPGAAFLGMGLAVQGITSVNRMAAAIQRHGRGRVGGLISLGPPAGGVLGTLVGGLLSQRWGAQSGFQVLAVCFALLCWVQWRHALPSVPD
jgi:MFS family permease